ncbi:MAG: bifunctional 5,10-methylene-tetrahydrofolate dehydrogenase/5,10-methylene-tetrahydrofolate cyclohydrolase [Synergistaceae bacterium]|jgi:methylenetetrahydrofolate dehydrogenase (NADP+)/methenyltetrahydrofolate cyclohydrolase|nr:bifunctional 5,10-methylene-tetrahydrofolate dehydrogenase/5,10-methylene-tetrahydrofolate cyclohydrolase [Synergistaceae bacterium]
MATIMKGSDVAAAMRETLLTELEKLRRKGVDPTLGVVRVGSRADDLAYERGVLKRFKELGIATRVFEFPEKIDSKDFLAEFVKVGASSALQGILLFRPLPKHLDEDAARRAIDPLKDMDGMNPLNVAKVFAGEEDGFAPCTSVAVMELLSHWGVTLTGKNVAIVGRSMVVGRPLAMLMLKKDATVTMCHTKTQNVREICREADILVAAAGRAHMVTPAFVSSKSIVVDVGINMEDGNLCGDVDYDAVSPLVSMITPVRGGVGAVTTSVLAKHILKAASLLAANL